ncbi:hypothetical protein [Micromonospora endophytica]|uniref:Uncharacterized protein n=1 Tax=Micromonospora endophytica TaxID=515350 RepID=A0A2W2CX77_9ACTN|nr:hypothetical protein [Micromonospora endophytica]PZF97914.1 hypothetical protein C1I93_10340 [Micromonospora endophytica]RIW42999.1 hypothetical protein D3H59_21480 [Micromonospora endophytica]BCJ61343.1 hypothetical protein Jiend_47650 [Micromonospora endophytica]
MTDTVTTPAELSGGSYESTVRTKAEQLKQELIRQTLDDVESWRKAVDVQWARDHPESPMSPIPPEEIEGYRQNVRNEYYEWVVPAFERHLMPDPDAINPMIDGLRTIESTFQGSQDGAGNFVPASAALSRINDVRSDLNHWEGDLQVNFIDNFLTPLQNVSVNQAAVAKVVREQLECSKVMYIRYRKAVVELLDQSIAAVRELNNSKDPKAHTWGTLVGIAVGTGLTLATGGVAVAGAVLIIGSTMAQGLVPTPPQTNDLSAPTAQEVAVNISDALSKLSGDVFEEERKVRDAFSNICETIATSRAASIRSNTSGPLAVATPAVSSARPSEITDGSLRPS